MKHPNCHIYCKTSAGSTYRQHGRVIQSHHRIWTSHFFAGLSLSCCLRVSYIQNLPRSVPSSHCFRPAPPPHLALLCSSRSLSATLSCALSFAVWRLRLLISPSLSPSLSSCLCLPSLLPLPRYHLLVHSLPASLPHPPPPSGPVSHLQTFFLSLLPPTVPPIFM